MNTCAPTNPDTHHRCPAEISSHGIWLYGRFCLSDRDVEELLLAGGVLVPYEAMSQWCRQFGQASAHQRRRRQPRPGDTWHRDDVCRTIPRERHDLWRAVDQEGHIRDSLVQRRRDQRTAKQFFRKRLKGLTDGPRVIITDQLKSYGAAKRARLPGGRLARLAISTTGRKIRPTPPGSGSGGCRG